MNESRNKKPWIYCNMHNLQVTARANIPGPVIYLFVQALALNIPKTVPNSVYFRYIWQHRPGLRANWQHLQFLLGHTLTITAQTKFTTGRLWLMRIEDNKEQISRFSFCAWVVWVFSMVQCVPTAVSCQAFVEPSVVEVKGSQCWQYLLSSAPVPSYSILGNLPDRSPAQRTPQHAHQITEAATLIKQLRKRPYREAWGTRKEP